LEEISLQKLTAKDVLLLAPVARKAYSDHYLHLWHDEGKWYLEKYFSVEKLAAELSDSNAVFYLALDNNEPAGFFKLNINAPIADNENALELERIYLTAISKGKGIGKKLVELTFAIAREKNKNLVWLKAMDSSADSISFYKRMGFEISGTYKLSHALMKEELKGMVVMTKSI
jgi:GNAT superfamily N-acetyltransferase